MGQFKPMVKMFTDEPSVILKLKKGGKVKAAGQAEGFKSMHSASGNPFDAAESGKAPKKPSMADRRKAMNPNQYAKGGKVAHKQFGGVLPGAAPMAAMARPALAAMSPAARMARAAMVRRALTGMKKGGSASDCAKLERELKHHESLSAAKAHGKASGGEIDAAETKTTLKNSVKPFAKTKMDTAHKDSAHGTGEVKEGKPGGYKHGGHAKHKAMGGTIEGNEGKFENTFVVDGDHADKAHGTGGVKMSNAGGFKKGGKIHHKIYGGPIVAAPKGGNPALDMDLRRANVLAARGAAPAAGSAFAKKGGKIHHKASGGAIDAKLTRTTVEGGNWENRPANSAKPGVKNTKTGEVKEANAGGYKHGGKASKKAYATGGNVVDDGRAVKMPHHFVSLPVANSLQSGTFKRGGKVKSFAPGGDVPPDAASQIKTNKVNDAYEAWKKGEKQEAMTNPLSGIIGAAKRLFSPESAASAASAPGAVTKTKESVTVSPKKRGGKC